MIQGNLASLDALGPEVVEKVRGAVDPGVLEAITRASRIAWLPLLHDIELTNAAGEVLGQQGRFDWARESMLVSLRTPLLEPIWRAAFRVFGMSPGALFRAVPSGWKAVYRNVGSVTHRALPSAAELVVRDLPEELVGETGYLDAMCGTFTALLDIAEVPGVVEVTRRDARRRTVEYQVRWGQALDA